MPVFFKFISRMGMLILVATGALRATAESPAHTIVVSVDKSLDSGSSSLPDEVEAYLGIYCKKGVKLVTIDKEIPLFGTSDARIEGQIHSDKKKYSFSHTGYTNDAIDSIIKEINHYKNFEIRLSLKETKEKHMTKHYFDKELNKTQLLNMLNHLKSGTLYFNTTKWPVNHRTNNEDAIDYDLL